MLCRVAIRQYCFSSMAASILLQKNRTGSSSSFACSHSNPTQIHKHSTAARTAVIEYSVEQSRVSPMSHRKKAPGTTKATGKNDKHLLADARLLVVRLAFDRRLTLSRPLAKEWTAPSADALFVSAALEHARPRTSYPGPLGLWQGLMLNVAHWSVASDCVLQLGLELLHVRPSCLLV